MGQAAVVAAVLVLIRHLPTQVASGVLVQILSMAHTAAAAAVAPVTAVGGGTGGNYGGGGGNGSTSANSGSGANGIIHIHWCQGRARLLIVNVPQ